MVHILVNSKNTSGWTACNLFIKLKYFKLINPSNKSTSKCSIKLSTKTRYSILFIFSNMRGVISRSLLQHIESSANFRSPLNALKFIVSISQSLTHWHTQTSLRRPGSLGPLTLRLLMSHIYIYIWSAYS